MLNFCPSVFCFFSLSLLNNYIVQIHEETGASVSTKGVWYPDRSKATEKDPPLYLHITAATQEALQKAINRIDELMNLDLGPLVEDKKDRMREKVGLFFFQN